MIVKTQAIVLHALKYGENGRILKAITAEEGLVPIFIRSVGNPKKGGINAFLEPMTRVELCYERRNGQGMASLKEIIPTNSSEIINTNIYTSAIAMFMAEVAQNVLHEEEKDLPLFELLSDWIQRLHGMDRQADIPLLYLFSLSSSLGFSPDLESKGAYFDLREGHFHDKAPAHEDYIQGDESQFLRSFLAFKADLGPRPHASNPKARSILLGHMLQYFKIHVQGFREIKSHKILAQIIS
jgi:DNA repair protein RecO (recombination protein O)